MKMTKEKLNIVLILFIAFSFSSFTFAQQDWTHKARIAGYPLSNVLIDSIIINSVYSNVFGIEVDNDITGRYESFLNPQGKLSTIKKMAEAAHKINNKSFVYVAGLECITPNANEKKHTFYKDHPDWVQRNIENKPAVFGNNDAFWIVEGDEDVWISPYATEWRKIYMQRIREIAATGIDGIYVDIPYWMTHFDGWENTWASFDDLTVKAFKEKTGLDAKKDIILGDFDDPGFIKWINFRMQTLTDFVNEIDENVKKINPDCKTIIEVYPGLSEEAVRVGADVFQMYSVVDVIAHEYSEGAYYAADRTASNWFNYIIGMLTFRAFAGDKASWMLSYSWYDNPNVKPSDAIKSLFASQVFSGTNSWDVKNFIMSSSNDYDTRKQIYGWIANNEDIIYSERKPIEPISVYFSDNTRNYFSAEFIDSYRGIINILLQSHLPINIVTSRNINKIKPQFLILPNVKCLSDSEISSFRDLLNNDTKFIITGEFAKFDENRKPRNKDLLSELFRNNNTLNNDDINNLNYFKSCAGKVYNDEMNSVFNEQFNNSTNYDTLNKIRNNFISHLQSLTGYKPKINIEAPLHLIYNSNVSNDTVYLFLLNVKGICEQCNAKDKLLKNIKITYDNSIDASEVYQIPFFGKKEIIKTTKTKDGFSFVVPEIERGTIISIKLKSS